MKKGIHPKYQKIIITCSCSNVIEIFSTYNKNTLNVDICSKCHPFYTGKQRNVIQGGRIERFNKKFL
ncbi:50S ribosomal protein L31 [Buchnera aphidicola]|uniref:Large ribosomal subunit protein bL31 n=1 Tax=Buchnera aphidicola (Sarucallis kahawaluokalani) TaxID=1241878 RepID=A0A4D6YJY2_9GAMM|nr:50S ribosomal protein L31 [Buchnera aphidicola]QCI26170.1 50S ribosomal protein L31 [Buchnera aphidicola (Sarucallis kahawaluokalani)]